MWCEPVKYYYTCYGTTDIGVEFYGSEHPKYRAKHMFNNVMGASTLIKRILNELSRGTQIIRKINFDHWKAA